MSSITKIITAAFLLFLIWFFYRQAKKTPGLLSKQNLLKGFNSMAVLALILIAFIWLCIEFLRH